MYQQTFNIGAYMPSLGAEQLGKAQEQLAVVDGRNFAWRIDGVFSAHGNEKLSAASLPVQRHVYLARIRNEQFYVSAGGVMRIAADGSAEKVYTPPSFPAPSHAQFWPWSYAYVGTKHWFCHPTVGLIWYDEHAKRWGKFWRDCWNGPAWSITHADNRLIVLLQDVVVWSRFDEGDKYAEDDGELGEIAWQSGSGFQSLALIRYGQPLAVMPYQGAWLTFTTMGVMVSTAFSQPVADPDGERLAVGAVVFTHEELTFEDIPLGPCAITHMDERQIVWLGKGGFTAFAPSQGGGFGAVTPWQPEMGSFYKQAVLPASQGFPVDFVQLSYVREVKWLFVSSRSEDMPIYDRAHVYQLDLDRWGSFDEQHVAFGESDFTHGDDKSSFGALKYRFVDESFRLRQVDHRKRNAASWLRFSPLRLQMPTEPQLPPQTISSVQTIRVGTTKLAEPSRWPAHLVSTWRREDFEQELDSRFDLFVSSGWDAETQNVDEGEYATLVNRGQQVIDFAVHSTGVTHSVLVTALRDNQWFLIRHLELGFFWAGIM